MVHAIIYRCYVVAARNHIPGSITETFLVTSVIKDEFLRSISIVIRLGFITNFSCIPDVNLVVLGAAQQDIFFVRTPLNFNDLLKLKDYRLAVRLESMDLLLWLSDIPKSDIAVF